MEYDKFLQEVQNLSFIRSRETADAAVKAVLGILASRLEENYAHELTRKLPEPLDFGKLRGHQVKVALMIPVESYIAEIGNQFSLDADQARRLVQTVFRTTKEAVGAGEAERLENSLTPDWAALLRES